MPNKEQQKNKNWHLMNAEGKVLGHLAPKIADLLRGKHKVTYTPHLDMGDHVVVINAAKFVVSGSKLESKNYYSHSGYPGNLRITPLGKLMKERPLKALFEAVKGMLPKNRLREDFLAKLHLYEGAEHTHQAQSPKELAL